MVSQIFYLTGRPNILTVFCLHYASFSFSFMNYAYRWYRGCTESNHCCGTEFFFSCERESQLSTVHEGYELAHNRGRNINMLLNFTYLKCLVLLECKFNLRLKMVLSNTIYILHVIICIIVKCAGYSCMGYCPLRPFWR